MTSINPIYNINYAQNPTFKAESTINQDVINTNYASDPNLAFKGTEALKAYKIICL